MQVSAEKSELAKQKLSTAVMLTVFRHGTGSLLNYCLNSIHSTQKFECPRKIVIFGLILTISWAILPVIRWLRPLNPDQHRIAFLLVGIGNKSMSVTHYPFRHGFAYEYGIHSSAQIN